MHFLYFFNCEPKLGQENSLGLWKSASSKVGRKCLWLIIRCGCNNLFFPRQGSKSRSETIAVLHACLFYHSSGIVQPSSPRLSVLSVVFMLVTTKNTIQSNVLRRQNTCTESIKYSALPIVGYRFWVTLTVLCAIPHLCSSHHLLAKCPVNCHHTSPRRTTKVRSYNVIFMFDVRYRTIII